LGKGKVLIWKINKESWKGQKKEKGILGFE
jgi:hypothetical protein